ncbi:MAG: hypothetical protein D6736_11710 [Nitrospinota bacterium]|nr:MAG: hypothetical protein D6736_11710 [Nitrospinota bacterium]
MHTLEDIPARRSHARYCQACFSRVPLPQFILYPCKKEARDSLSLAGAKTGLTFLSFPARVGLNLLYT